MTTVQDLTVDPSESQEVEAPEVPEPVHVSDEDTNGHAEKPKRKYTRRASASTEPEASGNGHPTGSLSEEEAALSLAESVEGQFETVRKNAVEALKTLHKQRSKLDASITSLEMVVDRYVGESVAPVQAPVHARRRAAAPKPIAKAKPKATTIRKRAGREPRRSNADLRSSCDQIVALLKKKGPMKTEDIRTALAISKPTWLTTAKHLKSDKRIKVSGERRAMTFQVK